MIEPPICSLGARCYSPNLGRFLTPDWSATPEAVPYANLENPQSLNLYSYVLNNPGSATDPDGHWCLFGFGTTCAAKPKLPVKEGGLAAAAAADATLSPGLDVSGILDGLKAAADSVTTGATTLGEGALGVVGGLLTFSQPLNPGEDKFMARVNAEIAADKDGAQDKKLTPGEIEKLKAAGHDPEAMKRVLGGNSKEDLYKDPRDNIYVKPKGSPIKGEPTGVNINDLGGHI